jgi:hypothetical protein
MVTGGEVPKNAMKAKMLKISLLLPRLGPALPAKKLGVRAADEPPAEARRQMPIERDRGGRS